MDTLIDVVAITQYFETLPDPRAAKNQKHRLTDLIVMSVGGVICGCEGPTAIHRWATHRKDWLTQNLALPNGIPSRDCIRRLLLTLQPQAFQTCFQNWIADLLTSKTTTKSKTESKTQSKTEAESPTPKNRLIAIDGKSCRGSANAAQNLGPLHLVSAWASEEGIALGQVAIDEKSNEITAIPELLKNIQLLDSIITIDAIGCQKSIIKQIKNGRGDCVIAVKKNQPKLYAAIEAFLADAIEADFQDRQYRHHHTSEMGHGRTEERLYSLAKVPADFSQRKAWPQVKAIGYALRYTQHADGSESVEIRYYVSTRLLSGKRFAEAVRGHWSIESMHWVLDVTFREDAQPTLHRRLVANLSWLRRFAITLLKRHPSKDSIKGKVQACGWSTDFLEEVLGF
jgi:predicted transposase YbfD/YdcC